MVIIETDKPHLPVPRTCFPMHLLSLGLHLWCRLSVPLLQDCFPVGSDAQLARGELPPPGWHTAPPSNFSWPELKHLA